MLQTGERIQKRLATDKQTYEAVDLCRRHELSVASSSLPSEAVTHPARLLSRQLRKMRFIMVGVQV